MKSTSRIFQALIAALLLTTSYLAPAAEFSIEKASLFRGGGDGPPYPLNTIETLWQSLDGRFTLKIYSNTQRQNIEAIEILDNSRKISLGWVQQILFWNPANHAFIILDSHNRRWQGQLWLPGEMNLEEKSAGSSDEIQFWIERIFASNLNKS